jgi:hypothetical protein
LTPRGGSSTAARVDGEVTVKVDLSGAPEGTKVTTETKGQVAKPTINVGKAFGGRNPVGAF